MRHFYLPAFCLRVAVFICAVFCATLVVIRAQPYTLETQHPFQQPDCTAACFAGIQPDVTSVEDAVAKLRASGWAKAVDNRTINNVSGFISWSWSDQKPSWISAEEDGKIWASQKLVKQILIYGDLQLGDTRLILGIPDQEVIDRSLDRTGELSLYTAAYVQTGLFVQSWQPCRVMEPFRRPVILTYTLTADPNAFPEEDVLTDLYHTCAFRRR